ncbi:MAG: hypothetical protein WBB28_03760 [Crinalium sp.]
MRYAYKNCDGDSGYLELYYKTDSSEFSELKQFLSLKNVEVVAEGSNNGYTEVIYDISNHVYDWIQILIKEDPHYFP